MKHRWIRHSYDLVHMALNPTNTKPINKLAKTYKQNEKTNTRKGPQKHSNQKKQPARTRYMNQSDLCREEKTFVRTEQIGPINWPE